MGFKMTFHDIPTTPSGTSENEVTEVLLDCSQPSSHPQLLDFNGVQDGMLQLVLKSN